MSIHHHYPLRNAIDTRGCVFNPIFAPTKFNYESILCTWPRTVSRYHNQFKRLGRQIRAHAQIGGFCRTKHIHFSIQSNRSVLLILCHILFQWQSNWDIPHCSQILTRHYRRPKPKLSCVCILSQLSSDCGAAGERTRFWIKELGTMETHA